jgi:hypothetical protein
VKRRQHLRFGSIAWPSTFALKPGTDAIEKCSPPHRGQAGCRVSESGPRTTWTEGGRVK